MELAQAFARADADADSALGAASASFRHAGLGNGDGDGAVSMEELRLRCEESENRLRRLLGYKKDPPPPRRAQSWFEYAVLPLRRTRCIGLKQVRRGNRPRASCVVCCAVVGSRRTGWRVGQRGSPRHGWLSCTRSGMCPSLPPLRPPAAFELPQIGMQHDGLDIALCASLAVPGLLFAFLPQRLAEEDCISGGPGAWCWLRCAVLLESLLTGCASVLGDGPSWRTCGDAGSGRAASTADTVAFDAAQRRSLVVQSLTYATPVCYETLQGC